VSANIESHKYQQQRLQAIRSAATVFAEKGFHGSSTRDIAEHMGIKQGSLYYYFKSKEEALGEVCLFGTMNVFTCRKRNAKISNLSAAAIGSCSKKYSKKVYEAGPCENRLIVTLRRRR